MEQALLMLRLTRRMLFCYCSTWTLSACGALCAEGTDLDIPFSMVCRTPTRSRILKTAHGREHAKQKAAAQLRTVTQSPVGPGPFPPRQLLPLTAGRPTVQVPVEPLYETAMQPRLLELQRKLVQDLVQKTCFPVPHLLPTPTIPLQLPT